MKASKKADTERDKIKNRELEEKNRKSSNETNIKLHIKRHRCRWHEKDFLIFCYFFSGILWFHVGCIWGGVRGYLAERLKHFSFIQKEVFHVGKRDLQYMIKSKNFWWKYFCIFSGLGFLLLFWFCLHLQKNNKLSCKLTAIWKSSKTRYRFFLLLLLWVFVLVRIRAPSWTFFFRKDGHFAWVWRLCKCSRWTFRFRSFHIEFNFQFYRLLFD